MKNTTFKASDHAKLDTQELQKEFIKWMKKEYDGYILNKKPFEMYAHNDGDFDWFVSEFLSYYNSEKTVFSLETKGGTTWYIDFQKRRNVFSVHQDEKFRAQRKSLGAAVSFILNRIAPVNHLQKL